MSFLRRAEFSVKQSDDDGEDGDPSFSIISDAALEGFSLFVLMQLRVQQNGNTDVMMSSRHVKRGKGYVKRW